MKILKKGITKENYNIQVEDWNENYNFISYGSTLAAYKKSKVSIKGSFTPKENQIYRFQFNFNSMQETEKAYNNLMKGNKSITEYTNNLDIQEYYNCI